MKPPDRWLVVRVRAPEDEDRRSLLASLLLEAGGSAVLDEEDCLVTHLPAPADLADWRRTVGRPIEAFARTSLSLSWQDHEEWAELWKVGLEPQRVGERLLVTPSWCTPETRPGDVVVTLDPGMAFGNAEHGTTRGALRLLEQAVREGDRVLDVGTGSGVLAIVAARLGASEVLALEADPWAAETARENVVRNGVEGRVHVEVEEVDGDELRRITGFDGVTANLEWGRLDPLLDGLMAAADRWLVLSGMQAEEWRLAADRCEGQGWVCAALDSDGAWRSTHLVRGRSDGG